MSEELFDKAITVRLKGETYSQVYRQIEKKAAEENISMNAVVLNILLQALQGSGQTTAVPMTASTEGFQESAACPGSESIKESAVELVSMLDRISGSLDEVTVALRRSGAISIEVWSAILSRTYIDGPVGEKMKMEAAKIIDQKTREINKAFPIAERKY